MKSKKLLTPLKRFINLLKVDKQDIFSIYIYALFNGIVALSLPLGIQAIINLITGGRISTSWVILVTFVIAGVAFTGVMQIMQLSITERIQQKIFTRSAFEFAYRIPRLQLDNVDKYYLPELVNRFFDTLSVQKGLSKILIDFSSATLQVIFGLLLLSLYHPFFILFSLVLIVIIYIIFRLTVPQGLRTSLIESKHKYEVAHWLEELARTMETFKLAGKSPLPLGKTDLLVSEYLKSRKAHFKTLLIQFINLIGFKVLITAGLLIIGGILVLNEQMNIGQFVASEIIILLVIASVEKLILCMETIYDVLTAIEKIGLVTDLPLEKSSEGFPNPEEAGLRINLNKLTYQFAKVNHPIINNVTLEINQGEKIALTGPQGSGKSFLLQVIAGLYHQFSGTLSYNKIPLGNWNIENLRTLIGDSLAREDIFNGSLIDNITLGKTQVAFEQVQALAELLNITDFIESLPAGYNTILLSEGFNLPKTIRQKIMLARCLAGNPKLLLLEDNFNQLSQTDRTKLLQYVLKQPYTVVAVSNNPETLAQFDKVAFLSKGEVLCYDNAQTVLASEHFVNFIKA